jgi:hypothetical protein
MKTGYSWHRCWYGKRTFLRRPPDSSGHDTCILSIQKSNARKRGGYYILDDMHGDNVFAECQKLAGPFQTLTAAKVSYLIKLSNEDERWWY